MGLLYRVRVRGNFSLTKAFAKLHRIYVLKIQKEIGHLNTTFRNKVEWLQRISHFISCKKYLTTNSKKDNDNAQPQLPPGDLFYSFQWKACKPQVAGNLGFESWCEKIIKYLKTYSLTQACTTNWGVCKWLLVVAVLPSSIRMPYSKEKL